MISVIESTLDRDGHVLWELRTAGSGMLFYSKDMSWELCSSLPAAAWSGMFSLKNMPDHAAAGMTGKWGRMFFNSKDMYLPKLVMCFGSYMSLLLKNMPDHAAAGMTGKWGMNDAGDWPAAAATAVTSSFQV